MIAAFPLISASGGYLIQSFNPIQDRGQKDPPPNFLNFGSNSFLCKVSRPYLVLVSNYWIWTKSTPQKNWFFWSDPYKIKVMITSLREVLEILKFGHMTISTKKLSHVIRLCLLRHRLKFWRHSIYFKIALANFPDIIKIATTFIETTFKDSKKLRRTRNYLLKCNLYLCFLI